MTSQEQKQLFFRKLRFGRGFICWKAPDGRFEQEAFETTSEALALIAEHGGEANIWCSMAGFRSNTNRAADNAMHLKSFWLDVDAHGTGPHETPKHALDAVKKFIASNQLPKPKYVNMTGHGVQVFWTVKEAVAKTDWQPVACDLQELAERWELGADSITADAARILRMPGTFNFRDPDNPVEAVLYETKAGYIDLNAFHSALKAALANLQSLTPKSKSPKALPKCIPDTPENVALIRAMLALLDPDCEYEVWRNICWAVAASGLSVSEDLALEWSERGSSWDEKAFYNVWNSFDPDREQSVGFGTLVHHARAAGYVGETPQAEEKFDKLEFKSDASVPVTITSRGLITQRACDIQPEPVEWLIEGAIPMGTMIVIGGQPGMGKSQIAIKLAAAITTGEGLPNV